MPAVMTAPETPPALPRLVVSDHQPVMPGKEDYRAYLAPANDRREWLYFVTRSGGQEVLRYELLNKMLFSADGTKLAIVYADAVYLLTGKRLGELLTPLIERQVEHVQEYDGARHAPLAGDECLVTMIESFVRQTIDAQEIIEKLHSSRRG